MGLFELGKLAVTPGAYQALGDSDMEAAKNIGLLLRDHSILEPGELGEEDVNTNWDAIKCDARVFSAFSVRDTKFWVITEADRSVTTILLPEEY